jgi:hypothetical protein
LAKSRIQPPKVSGMANLNHKAEHPIARRAAAVRLLAKCDALDIRVWMRHGRVRFCMLDEEQRVPAPWLIRLMAYRTEIADIIGYHAQRRVAATEIIVGCRIYWLPTTRGYYAASGDTDTGPNAA